MLNGKDVVHSIAVTCAASENSPPSAGIRFPSNPSVAASSLQHVEHERVSRSTSHRLREARVERVNAHGRFGRHAHRIAHHVRESVVRLSVQRTLGVLFRHVPQWRWRRRRWCWQRCGWWEGGGGGESGGRMVVVVVAAAFDLGGGSGGVLLLVRLWDGGGGGGKEVWESAMSTRPKHTRRATSIRSDPSAG